MKKKLILAIAILLGCAGLAKADVVINSLNFPDSHFRSWVQWHFSRPNGATLTDEELASLKELNTNKEYQFNYVQTLKGIEFFTELEVINIYNCEYGGNDYNTIQSLDLSKNKKLKKLRFNGETVFLKEANLANLPELEIVDIIGHELSNLDLHGCRNLKELKFSDGHKNLKVDLDTCLSLEVFYSKRDNAVGNVDFSLMPNLKILNFDYSKLTTLDLTSLKNLEEFSCKDNNLTRLDLSNCKKLKKLNCSGTPIPYLLGCSQLDSLTSIDVSNCVKLKAFPTLPVGIKTIACDNVNSFANVDINSYPNLTSLSAANCGLTVFDAANLPNLTALDLSDNHIAAINIAPSQTVEQKNFKLDQRLDITAIPDESAYWRVILPQSVDMDRFYSYDFVDDAAKRSYTLYNEYFNGSQGQQPSFVTNYVPTSAGFTKNIIYQYKTGAYYVEYRKNVELVSNVTIYTKRGASGVDDVVVSKAVASHCYYNMSGVRFAEKPAAAGVYVEQTIYTDGTSSAQKVLVK